MSGLIAFKPLRPEAVVPQRAHATDSGLDLIVTERTELPFNTPVAVGHGIAVELPVGHEGQIRPRSSALLKRGLLIPVGTIDNGYRGELATVVVNVLAQTVVLEVGDRISQLVVSPVSLAEAVVSDLTETARGGAGFGSTDAP